LRFDADLLPFFDDRFRFVISAARATPRSVSWALDREMAEDEPKAFSEHLAKHDFNYLDLSGNASPVVGDVEVKAVFTKIANVVNHTIPKTAGLENQIVFEAVVGNRGRFTRQRLHWVLGRSVLMPFAEDADDALFPCTPDPAEMVMDAGGDLQALVTQVETLTMTAFAHAQKYAGTAMAMPVLKIRDGHPILFRPRGSVKRTLFDVVELRSFHEVEGKPIDRKGAH
jgi:hypothetical protein